MRNRGKQAGPVVDEQPCAFCEGGTLRLRRTRDPFEDTWECDACHASGTVSWSRVWGERAREVAARKEAGR
jgi:hypothetical protein